MKHTCIGCGKPRSKKPHTYCRRCRDRVNAGITVEAEDVPSMAECRRWCRIAVPLPTTA